VKEEAPKIADGQQRDENEWNNIFQSAFVGQCELMPKLCVDSGHKF